MRGRSSSTRPSQVKCQIQSRKLAFRVATIENVFVLPYLTYLTYLTLPQVYRQFTLPCLALTDCSITPHFTPLGLLFFFFLLDLLHIYISTYLHTYINLYLNLLSLLHNLLLLSCTLDHLAERHITYTASSFQL